MYTEDQVKKLIRNYYSKFCETAAISTIKGGQAIRDKEMFRMIVAMEASLIIVGVIDAGIPLPYNYTEHKFLCWDWKCKEHYYALILRLAEEYLGIITSIE